MKKIIQKICSDAIKQYKPDKNVLGILLFGSAARNKFDKYSDVDIYVLLRKKGVFSRSNFIKNGLRIDVIFNTITEARNYLKQDKNNLRRITSHMIAHGVILFQRGKNLEEIQAVAMDNLGLKTQYGKNDVLMHKYSIDDFWGEVRRDMENKNYIAFGLDSHLLISNIIELSLKLKGETLRQPNEIKNILSQIDKKLAGYIENFYKEGSFQKKKIILANLVRHIYKVSGGQLPNKWALRG